MLKQTLALIGLLISASIQADPVELISNGGFESGLTSWSCSDGSCTTTTDAHSGNLAFSGYSASDGRLSQAYSTEVGETYQLSFWSKNNLGAAATGESLRYFSIADLNLVNVAPTDDYSLTSAQFVATSTSTTILFRFLNANEAGRWQIDDVSVSQVPIPAAAWLFGSALLGLGAIKRNRA